MPSINHAFKEITCKIVYYGPGAGGKTTNLYFIHGHIPSSHRGDMVSLATEQDRTLFFDYLPLDIGDIKGYQTKFNFYTVPGQVYYNATRKLVLRAVDAIVFVADSQPNRLQDSLDSFKNLIENLRDIGLDLNEMPFVMQYNKRDLPDALPVETMREALNPDGMYAEYEAVATDGTGVQESLRDVAQQLLRKLNSNANFISDEQVVTERLGVAGATGPVAPRVSVSDRKAPTLSVNQESNFQWHGFGVGKGFVTLKTSTTERGETEYELQTEHKVLGSKRSISRKMRYVGEDKQTQNGVDRTYQVLRDASVSRDGAPMAAFVETGGGVERIYLIYPGIAGEMKVGPVGETNPF